MFIKLLSLFLLSTSIAEAAYFPTFSINNFNALGVYNLTPPTLTNGANSQLQVDVNGSLRTTQSSLPLPAGAATSANQATEITALGTINTTLGTPMQQTGGTVAATQSGTWNINNISGTVSLPTGAATATNQTTANTTLATISGQLPSLLGAHVIAGSTAVNIASDQTVPISAVSLPLPSGASTSAKQPALGTAGAASSDVISVQGIASMTALKVDGSAVTQPVSIAASVQTKAPLNTTGSGSAAAATVSTVATLTAPANAFGFIIMNLDTSTANIRWAVGRTASTTLGQQLQPGRDTGFVPVGANISIIAESGTQNYDVQWVSQ